MRKISGFLGLVFLILALGVLQQALAAEEDFVILKQKVLANNLGVYRQIRFNNLETPIEISQVTLGDAYKARLYLQEEKNQLFAKSLEEISRANNFLLGINGGYYTPSYQAVGLLIEEGKTLQNFKKSRLLTSCIGITPTNKLFLGTLGNNCRYAYYAVQAGPWLIDSGEINPNIKMLQDKPSYLESFFNRNRRTILAESIDKKIIVLITPAATLLEVATILKKYPEVFGVSKIATAVNLDGGSSTGMYVQFDSDQFYFPETRRVKTLLFFDT